MHARCLHGSAGASPAARAGAGTSATEVEGQMGPARTAQHFGVAGKIHLYCFVYLKFDK